MLKIKTEIFDRVSGYYRPTSQYNKGKKEEQGERKRLKYNMEVLEDGYKKTADVS